MDRIWAPWRSAYIQSGSTETSPTACVFCDMQSEGDDRSRLVLYRAERTFVVMNRFPYNNGHLLVMPYAHVGHFDGLDDDTFQELHRMVHRSVKALEAALRPEGINIGMNFGKVAGAGIPGHMHYHLVPRWNGDTNFMPVIGETRVISQHILESYDQLKPHFEQQ